MLRADPIRLEVRKKMGKIAGRVQGADGDGPPIPNAKLYLDGGLSGTTDSGGHFELVIPGDRLRPQMEIEVAANGYELARYSVVPNSEHVVRAMASSSDQRLLLGFGCCPIESGSNTGYCISTKLTNQYIVVSWGRLGIRCGRACRERIKRVSS